MGAEKLIYSEFMNFKIRVVCRVEISQISVKRQFGIDKQELTLLI